MVYFIISEDKKHVKIGCSKDPLLRLKDLQTGNPYKLHILFTCYGDFQVEAGFHSVFSKYRVRGNTSEWFKVKDKLKLGLMILRGTQNIDPKTIKSGKDLERAICHLQVRQKQNRTGKKLI